MTILVEHICAGAVLLNMYLTATLSGDADVCELKNLHAESDRNLLPANFCR